jgi:hypothetical protein
MTELELADEAVPISIPQRAAALVEALEAPRSCTGESSCLPWHAVERRRRTPSVV